MECKGKGSHRLLQRSRRGTRSNKRSRNTSATNVRNGVVSLLHLRWTCGIGKRSLFAVALPGHVLLIDVRISVSSSGLEFLSVKRDERRYIRPSAIDCDRMFSCRRILDRCKSFRYAWKVLVSFAHHTRGVIWKIESLPLITDWSRTPNIGRANVVPASVHYIRWFRSATLAFHRVAS